MKNRLLRIFISHSLPLLFTSVILGGGAMAISCGFAARSSEREAHNTLEQVQAYYEVVIAEMDSLNLIFSTNPEIISRIRHILETERWDWIDANYARLLRSYISAPANARPYIDSIYVYLQNAKNRVLTSQDGVRPLTDMADTSWYDTFISGAAFPEVYAEHAVLNREGPAGMEKHLLRVYRTIYDSKPRPIGVIVLNLLEDRLVNVYPSLLAGGAFLTVSGPNGNRLLSIPRDSGGEAEYPAGGGFVRFSLKSARLDWRYELSIPRRLLYRLPRLIGLMTVSLSCAVCVMGLLLTYTTHQKETRFLKNVLDQFEAAGARPLDQAPMKNGENIFDYLNSRILRTFLEQDYLRMQKEVMEYRALQMQINPHFLFNTLDTINWNAVALLKGPNDISRMLLLLSRILKYSIRISENPGAPLEEEIEHTRYYLELQYFRWAGLFSADWDVAPGLGGIPVPRLIFQPILENAFAHGFRGDERKLEIRIRVYREGPPEGNGPVVIEIADNGEGIEPEILEQLNAREPAMPGGNGFVGFINTRKRIALLYRGRAEISAASEKGRGTSVRITLPELARRPP
jgi:two-component system sensor histidine kinase YesM